MDMLQGFWPAHPYIRGMVRDDIDGTEPQELASMGRLAVKHGDLVGYQVIHTCYQPFSHKLWVHLIIFSNLEDGSKLMFCADEDLIYTTFATNSMSNTQAAMIIHELVNALELLG
jgi:hypothetical protein